MKNKKEILKFYNFRFKIFILTINIAILAIFFLLPKDCVLAKLDANQLISLTNQERLANGLEPLEIDQTLINVAQNKCQDMVNKNYFSHTNPDGKHFWQWLKEIGYDYLYAGENLAIDFFDNEEVVKAWLASSTHRANILNPKYRQIGLAIKKGMINNKETIVIAQEFGTPYRAENPESNSPETAIFILPSLTGRDKVDLFTNVINQEKTFPEQFAANLEINDNNGGLQAILGIDKDNQLVYDEDYQNSFLKTLTPDKNQLVTALTQPASASTLLPAAVPTTQMGQVSKTLTDSSTQALGSWRFLKETKKDVLGENSVKTSIMSANKFIKPEEQFTQLIYLFILLISSILVNLVSLAAKLHSKKEPVLSL